MNAECIQKEASLMPCAETSLLRPKIIYSMLYCLFSNFCRDQYRNICTSSSFSLAFLCQKFSLLVEVVKKREREKGKEGDVGAGGFTRDHASCYSSYILFFVNLRSPCLCRGFCKESCIPVRVLYPWLCGGLSCQPGKSSRSWAAANPRGDDAGLGWEPLQMHGLYHHPRGMQGKPSIIVDNLPLIECPPPSAERAGRGGEAVPDIGTALSQRGICDPCMMSGNSLICELPEMYLS